MSDPMQFVEELRRMSTAELVRVGEDSLHARLREQAEEARAKHGALSPANLETVLEDRDCVRFPIRLVLEYGEMGLHQFAQPEPDYRYPNEKRFMLYLRPSLGQRPDWMALAVAYMIPVINYGQLIHDEHCLTYGAELLGMDVETYYQRICEMADALGAESQTASGQDSPFSNASVESVSGGCGSGCGCHPS